MKWERWERGLFAHGMIKVELAERYHSVSALSRFLPADETELYILVYAIPYQHQV